MLSLSNDQFRFLYGALVGISLFLLLAVLVSCGGETDTVDKTIEMDPDAIFAMAEQKYVSAASQLDTADGMPRNAYEDGSWRQVGLEDWTTGFFPGILWQIYDHTESEAVREQAHKWTMKLLPSQYFRRNHDIGFIMFNSFGKGYQLTEDSVYYNPVLTAAETGIERFNPASGVIRSWDFGEGFPTIIDNMMNLRLYAFAFAETGDSTYLHVLESHADTTLKHHFRPDGSTWHVLDYYPDGRGVKRKITHQGASDESTWARGQAWAIYGFTEVYQQLPKPEYLAIARKAADLFISRLPADTIPYWDFDAPGIPDEPKDASAAAIAASALFDLADLTGEERYAMEAERQLRALSSPKHLAGKDDPMGGLMRHATGNKPREDRILGEIDLNINYADYYYLEALNKYVARQPTDKE